ncbi:putative chitinase 3 [Orchesella cincta]|uniref:Putative chitinase 3 n=1 Tax=Orchesella cincta TaxID=48709 RepID=A0A1D2MQQ7_ORCCI|nr:putative chitinase 3 [Orchesella cincta]
MKKFICGVGGIFLQAVLLSLLIAGTFGDPKEECQPRNKTYNIADSKQCDMYHECGKAGKPFERLCDDGFQFSEEINACDYPHNVNCSGRELLQEPKSVHPHCPRMNGFYAFPPADSCQKFYHCLEGNAYEKTCPEGVIFDPKLGACIHPDLSHRKDCRPDIVLNFTCPNYGKKFARLRFGDHDRVSHPTNCRKFFICLADGKPRVGGCPLGKVFNPKLGVCDQPKKVPQCKDYYGKRDPAKLAKLAELGEEASLNLNEDDEVSEPHIETDDSEEEQENEAVESKNANANKGKKFHTKRQAPAFAPDATQVGPENLLTGPQNQNSGKTSVVDSDDDSADEDVDEDD